MEDTAYQRIPSNTFRGEGGAVRTFENRRDALKMVFVEIPSGIWAANAPI
jgi:hypothetical protein